MALHRHTITLTVSSFYPITEKKVEIKEEENGTLWIGEAETFYQVNFCPICGYEARKKINKTIGEILRR